MRLRSPAARPGTPPPATAHPAGLPGTGPHSAPWWLAALARAGCDHLADPRVSPCRRRRGRRIVPDPPATAPRRNAHTRRPARQSEIPSAWPADRRDPPTSRSNGPPARQSKISTSAIGCADHPRPRSWTVDTAARRTLERELFGKRVLVTDREDWPVAEVVAGYRSQNQGVGKVGLAG